MEQRRAPVRVACVRPFPARQHHRPGCSPSSRRAPRKSARARARRHAGCDLPPVHGGGRRRRPRRGPWARCYWRTGAHLEAVEGNCRSSPRWDWAMLGLTFVLAVAAAVLPPADVARDQGDAGPAVEVPVGRTSVRRYRRPPTNKDIPWKLTHLPSSMRSKISNRCWSLSRSRSARDPRQRPLRESRWFRPRGPASRDGFSMSTAVRSSTHWCPPRPGKTPGRQSRREALDQPGCRCRRAATAADRAGAVQHHIVDLPCAPGRRPDPSLEGARYRGMRTWWEFDAEKDLPTKTRCARSWITKAAADKLYPG